MDENLFIKFEDVEGTNSKIGKIKKVVNWLYHEMINGRVNNNKQALQNDIKLSEQKLTTPLSIAFVKMVEKGEIDEVTASENAGLFLEWNEKSSYKANDLRQRNGQLYKCLQDHTAQADWTPENSPSLWKLIGINENGIPEYSKPLSAADAYMKGDECMYNGVHKRSTIDNNVWTPDEYPEGWEDVIEEATEEI